MVSLSRRDSDEERRRFFESLERIQNSGVPDRELRESLEILNRYRSGGFARKRSISLGITAVQAGLVLWLVHFDGWPWIAAAAVWFMFGVELGQHSERGLVPMLRAMIPSLPTARRPGAPRGPRKLRDPERIVTRYCELATPDYRPSQDELAAALNVDTDTLRNALKHHNLRWPIEHDESRG